MRIRIHLIKLFMLVILFKLFISMMGWNVYLATIFLYAGIMYLFPFEFRSHDEK